MPRSQPSQSPPIPGGWADAAAAIAFRREPPRRQGVVRGHRIQQWTFPDGTVWASFHRTRAGYQVRFPDFADFVVSATGDEVSCRPAPGISSATIDHIYVNQVVPLALSRAGRLVFHASAVDVGGQGIAFMGASGRGKSTLAAAFAAGGCGFLTDDGLLLDARGGRARIMPGAPSLRLWEDSRAALVAAKASKGKPAPYSAKRHLQPGPGLVHCARPLPLRRVYFLGEGSATLSIERLSPSEALIELVRHSFLIDVESEQLLASHFASLARIAERAVYFRLDYPRRFEALAATREAIVAHARRRIARAARAAPKGHA